MRRIHRATATAALGALVLAGPSRAFDLEATALEATQSVQNLSNSVVLIEAKKTYVRFHVRVADGIDLVRVAGELSGTRGGSPLGALVPSPPTVVARLAPDRAQKDQSFLFELPRSWTSGTIQLTGTVDPENAYGESNETNNAFSTTVSFVEGNTLILHHNQIVVPGGSAPSALDNFSFFAWVLSAYPIRTLDLRSSQRVNFSVDVTNDRCNCPRDASDRCTASSNCANDSSRSCSGDTDCGCSRVNQSLVAGGVLGYLLRSSPSALLRTRFYGMVDEGTGFMRGCADGVPGYSSSGPTGNTRFAWDTDGTYGDWYGGHEVAHTLGRPHSMCCGALGGITSPYPNCQISPPDNSIFGFDTSVEQVYPPTSSDHMSYCNNQWLSDFNYSALFGDVAFLAFLGDVFAGASGPRVFFAGRGNTDLGIVSLGPAYAVTSALPAIQRPPGDWELRFLDGQGQTLGSHSFDPLFEANDKNLVDGGAIFPGVDQMVSIAEVVDAVPGTAEVQLYEAGNLHDTLVVSPNAPFVSLLSPNGGESLGSSVTVSWQAGDADGGSLLATVLYSPDGGVEWIPLAVEEPGSSVTASLEGVPGSTEGLFGVLVTDGYNTAFDISDDKVSVANNSPLAFILSPDEDGRQYKSGALVILEAFARDAEDQTLPDANLLWSSDREGALGTGNLLETSLLVLGAHELTLEALDSGGAVSTDSVSVEVVVPEPGMGISLVACFAVLAALRARRRT
jgi:hypothetical protein